MQGVIAASVNTIMKISPFALPKLQKYLDKFKSNCRRSDTMNAAERYMTGLLSDIPYKNRGMIADNMVILAYSWLTLQRRQRYESNRLYFIISAIFTFEHHFFSPLLLFSIILTYHLQYMIIKDSKMWRQHPIFHVIVRLTC